MLDFSADCGILVLRVTFAVLMALDIYVAIKVGKLPIFMPKVELKGWRLKSQRCNVLEATPT